MSGIVGIFHRDRRPIDPRQVETLMALAPHRGPDGSRHWVHADGVGLGHQLFASTPESAWDRQPLADDRGLTIAFDGRIDNRGELVAALEAPRLRAAPDAAIVLAAYAEWAEETPARLLGDFAFVVWDAPRQRLFCARDVVGIRPFYYAIDDRRFVCASDLRQVVPALPSREVNEGMVGEHLVRRIQHQEETLYRGLFRLPAAHWMAVDRDSVRQVRYWRYDTIDELRYATDREYEDHFFHLFSEAVACRMRSDRPTIGAYLSGGIDSSSVVVTALSQGAALETFSMMFPRGTRADEREFIDDVLRRWTPAAAHRVEIPPIDPARCLAHVASRLDTLNLPGDIASEPLLARMRDRGMRVVLTGHGGDFGFAGSLYHYAEMLRAGDLAGLARQWRDDRSISDVGWSPGELFMSGIRPLLPKAVKDAVRPLAKRFGWVPVAPDWIPADFAARIDLSDRIYREVPLPQPGAYARQYVCGLFAQGWTYLLNEHLERATSEFGLELRHPFFDRRLIEFAIALPERQRWRGRQTKAVVREALRDLLPPLVYGRTDKGDFAVQVVDAIEAIGGLSLVGDLEIARRGWVSQDRVVEMYRDMRSRFDANDATYDRYMFALWMIAGIELWYRMAIEGRGVRETVH